MGGLSHYDSTLSLLNTGVVATHCLFEAVVALVARTRGLKAILLEDGGNEGAGVCKEED
jgi:hypothetical protein